MIKVLVVDDSALMRKLLGRVLADVTDFEVYFARNGMEALEQLAAVNPDVVTLDVHMPQMDGLACLDRIMIEHPCPVVMVSSLTARARMRRWRRCVWARWISSPSPTAPSRCTSTSSRRARRQGACGRRREAEGQPAAAGARAASHRRQPRRSRRTRTADRGRGVRARADTATGLVLVGTSTGGPPALEALLVALPATFPWPILIAQHMPASFTGAAREPPGRALRDRCERGRAAHAAEPGQRLYRPRRRRHLISKRRAASWSRCGPGRRRAYPGIPAPTGLVRERDGTCAARAN